MLHNSSRLEHRGHHREVAADIYQRAIAEEQVRIAPETMRVFVVEILHLVSAVLSVFFFAVRTTPYQKLDIEVVLIQQGLDCV